MKIFLQSVYQHDAFMIVQHPTGIFYTHQFDGDNCDYVEVEGYLIPLYKHKGFDWDAVISGNFIHKYTILSHRNGLISISVDEANIEVFGKTRFNGFIVYDSR